jgi:hypothetical protein
MQSLKWASDDHSVDELFYTARHGTLDAALSRLGSFVSGQPGYAVFCGQAIRTIGSALPLVGHDGPIADVDAATVTDPVLTAMGLEWVRLGRSDAGCRRTDRRAATAALVLRAGLLARILDRSYRHLEPRESGGQRVLQHQLVRACFVESFGAAEQMRLEATYLLDEARAIDPVALHRGLTSATMKAAKLMGGHGYLLGETNSIEFLSLCLAGMCCQSGAGQGTGAASRDLRFARRALEELAT